MSRAERVPQYRGDLRVTTLPEMLSIIDRTRVAGVIEAVRDETRKSVYLDNGYVVHAASTDLADSLGAFLRRTGRLSDGQFRQAMERRSSAPRRLGELLVEQGVLAPAEVHRAIRSQVEEVLWSLFSWEEGEVTFSLGAPDLVGIVRIQIPLRQVVVQGVKRAANAKILVGRVGGREAIFEPAYRFEELIEVALEADEYELLSRVDGRKTFYELCTGGPVAAADAARLLYAFSVLGLIRKAGTGEPKERPVGVGIKIKLKTDT